MAAAIRLSQQHSCSFDYLVGHSEELVWDSEAEYACGLCVDDQLQLARLHDRQIRRLRALEDAAGIDADLTKCIRRVASIADKPANFSEVAVCKCRGDRVARRQIDQLEAAANEKAIAADEKRVGPLAHKSCKGRVDLPTVAGLEDLELQPHSASSRFHVSQRSLGSGISRIDEHGHTSGAGHQLTSSSSRFAVTSTLKKLIPVKLPPGRARLATSPSLTGSSATTNTMGIVVVPALAANAEAKFPAAITATCRRTSSAASAGSRSNCPSAERYSSPRFRPRRSQRL